MSPAEVQERSVEETKGGEPQRRSPALSLLTGGFDKPYTYGLALALAAAGAEVEIVGSDQLDCPEFHSTPGIRFLNLRGDQSAHAASAVKIRRVLVYYWRLLRYAASATPTIFHILWNNKLQTLDRTLLMVFYRSLGKKIVVTAHNINQARRDGRDSGWNRLTLKIQYRLAHRLFVHTEGMKADLYRQFGIAPEKVIVIPFGINNAAPQSALTREEARVRLGLAAGDRALLFFGNIRPYKGLEYLVQAFGTLAERDRRYRLMIAGAPHFGDEAYLERINSEIRATGHAERVMAKFEHIPDEDTEIYFKAADLLVLPYTDISWSGVLVLGYSFGLPAVATSVGALPEEVIAGQTGGLCPPRDAEALAKTVEQCFAAGVTGAERGVRERIRDWAENRYSWRAVAREMLGGYRSLRAANRSYSRDAPQ